VNIPAYAYNLLLDILPVKDLHPESHNKTALNIGIDLLFTDQDAKKRMKFLNGIGKIKIIKHKQGIKRNPEFFQGFLARLSLAVLLQFQHFAYPRPEPRLRQAHL
jgi:hypothetical protein